MRLWWMLMARRSRPWVGTTTWRTKSDSRFKPRVSRPRRFRRSSKERRWKFKAWPPKKPAPATWSCLSNGKAGPWECRCLNFKPLRRIKQSTKPSLTGITGWLKATVFDTPPNQFPIYAAQPEAHDVPAERLASFVSPALLNSEHYGEYTRNTIARYE